MKHLLIALFASVPMYLQAQKCSYEFDKVDDFTKERAVSSEFLRIYIHGKGRHAAAAFMSYAAPGAGVDGSSARKEELFFSACNFGGKNLLGMKVRSTDSRSTFFNQKYMLLLENGAIVSLWRVDEGKHGGSVSFTSDAGWASYLLATDKKGWENLKISGVKKIRMPKDRYNNYDIEIDARNADVIQKGIACIEALHIKNVKYESESDANETNVSSSIPKNNIKGETIPSLLLNKKWHTKFSTNAGNKQIEVEANTEYFATNDVLTETISTINGRKNVHESRCKFEIANKGKYIIHYYEKGNPQTHEIISLEEGVFITKSLSDGKVYVHNKM